MTRDEMTCEAQNTDYEPSEADVNELSLTLRRHLCVSGGTLDPQKVATFILRLQHIALVAAAKAERERCKSTCQKVAYTFGDARQFRSDFTIGREDGAIQCEEAIRAMPVEGGLIDGR